MAKQTVEFAGRQIEGETLTDVERSLTLKTVYNYLAGGNQFLLDTFKLNENEIIGTAMVAKDKLDAFLAELQKEHTTYAPVKKGSKTVWAKVDKAAEMAQGFSNTDMSPKEFFFPQTECMMRFNNDASAEDGMIMKAEPEMAGKQALVNIRPCDGKAFGVLDMIFCQDEYTDDVFWRDKREKTLLVGLACDDPCPTCFCTSMNSGPHAETGLDLLLVDLGDKFLVKVVSEKGEAAASSLPAADQAADKAAAGAKDAAEKIASGQGQINPDTPADVRAVIEQMVARIRAR